MRLNKTSDVCAPWINHAEKIKFDQDFEKKCKLYAFYSNFPTKLLCNFAELNQTLMV